MASSRINLKDLPKKSVLLIEEDLGDIKRIFIQSIGSEAIKDGKEVVYVTTRLKDDIIRHLAEKKTSGSEKFDIFERFKDFSKLPDICTGDICIIENFTEFFIEGNTKDLMNTINSLIDTSRSNGRIILLTSNMGIIPERSERILRSMVDGIIQFLADCTGNRINRLMNIPKLDGNLPLDRLIPFTVAKEGIILDTRERF